MTTVSVRHAVHELMAFHGMTTMFGNPGSNELPFLKDLPARYILGLHEATVVAMADGYSQITDRPTLINLHAASGTSNGLGALTNSVISRSKLVITAGQQVRDMVGPEVMLANVQASKLAEPLVHQSLEPLSAADVPRAFSQSVFASEHGPVYLSVPYDDWDAEVPASLINQLSRTVSSARTIDPKVVSELADRLQASTNPVLVLGPDVDDERAWQSSTALAEALDLPVWAAPSLSRLPFPNQHPNFRGVLPAGIAPIGEILGAHDLALVIGAPVFRYHQWQPGEYLPETTELIQIGEDAAAAARAPFGDALIADPIEAIISLAAELGATAQGNPSPTNPSPANPATPPEYSQIEPAATSAVDGVLHPEEVFATLRETMPADTRFVVESTSTNAAFWAQMDLRHPGSYFFPASGGLGWGLPASMGVALADPDRPVVAIIGDGSAHYSISALRTAVEENIPVIIILLRNGTYGALDWFADMLGVDKAPGLDLGEVDFVSIATGYQMTAAHAETTTELQQLITEAADRARERRTPTFIEVNTEKTRPEKK
ncbi:benzoylformate decarboxylase [Brevibacterium sp. ZH18]|uniref:benzoylformate decarboxylase n=1 Tax=Brevibacterium sp. ZH18 TaxID=2927784 RepID=UPI001F617989|nr:benzoylformate decarboxylase [Brevibacterium sp. ZH18]MCI4012790.1 benzoylformate decarboxylase [Brevibacterium sp. ZH18]